MEHATGDWALNFLCLTLAVTPLVRATGWSWWMRRRRMIGLFAAFYATLHFATYFILDMELDLAEFLRDAAKRPYILAGAGAFALLIPLAATSTDAMIRRLRAWWPRLHRLVYAAAVLAVIHYLWLVKADRSSPLRYAAVVAVLLGWRAWSRVRRIAA